MILLSISIVLLCGCTQKKMTEEEEKIASDIQYLTSDESDGRRPGTQGNEYTREYLEDRFREIGLGAYNESYTFSFHKQISSIGNINLKISDDGKVEYTLEYGTDYIEIFLTNENIELPLLESPSGSDCVILTDDIGATQKYANDNSVKLILVKSSSDNFKRNGFFLSSDTTQSIRVSSNCYSKLKKSIGKTIQLTYNINKKEEDLKNVIGMIPGKDNNSAIVITAHFDHVGSVQGNRDIIIWRGAFDNASGVAAMLKVATEIKETYKYIKPPCNIIFCALNSEEAISEGESGGSYFNREIGSKYKYLMNINLDCIGSISNDNLLVYSNRTEGSTDFAKGMTENLNKLDLKASHKKEPYSGDNNSFENAISITTQTESDKIHTLSDKPEIIDYVFLTKASKGIAAE